MSFVIFDTEYTSWKGCQEYGWQGMQKKVLTGFICANHFIAFKKIE